MKVPPYEFRGNCLIDSTGQELCLFHGVREFLDWASERFVLSIASWNLEDKVRPILEGFGLWDYFLFPKIEGHPNKADMIRRTLDELSSIGYNIEESFTWITEIFTSMRLGGYFPQLTLCTCGWMRNLLKN